MIMLTLEYLKLKFLWLNENPMKINIKAGESCNLTNRTYKDLIRYLKGINTKSNVIRLKVHNTSIGLMRKYLLIRITKATTGYWYVFRLSVRIALFLVWWLSMILRTYLQNFSPRNSFKWEIWPKNLKKSLFFHIHTPTSVFKLQK